MNKGLKYILLKKEFDIIKNEIKSNGIYYKDIFFNTVIEVNLDSFYISESDSNVLFISLRHFDRRYGFSILYVNSFSDFFNRYISITKEQYENYPL